jgi:hypothetical protein
MGHKAHAAEMTWNALVGKGVQPGAYQSHRLCDLRDDNPTSICKSVAYLTEIIKRLPNRVFRVAAMTWLSFNDESD